MNTLLVWVMVSTTAAFQPPPPPTQFPSQADCTRMISALTQAGKFPYQYRCVSTRVVNPYDTRQTQFYSDDEAAAAARGQRNGDYNQRKLDAIIKGR